MAIPIPEHVRAPDHRKDDPHTGLMYETLVGLSSLPEVKRVIEVGSTNGRGSTVALREGLERNSNFPDVRLFCIEAVKKMFDELTRTKARYMKCYRVCSSPPEEHYTDEEIRRFFEEDWPKLMFECPAQRQTPSWHIRERDRYIAYFLQEGLPLDGINLIKEEYQIRNFDLAFVDGGTYSGSADAKRVYGAKYLVLDDIYTLKCTWIFRELRKDPAYEMIMHKEMGNSHCGYAAFRKKK